MANVRQAPVRNRLFAGLSVADRELLRPHLKPVGLDLHEAVLRAGEPIGHVVFVEQGVVSALADAAAGRVEVGMIGREGLVGLSVVHGIPREAHDCVVHEAGEGFRVTSRDFRAAMDESPSMRARFTRYAYAFLVQVSQTAYANASLGIEARVARCILMTHDRAEHDELVLTHDLLSMKLGARRPGVTVAVHVLEGNGLIRATRGRIAVRDRAGLEAAAGAAYGLAEAEYDRAMEQEPDEAGRAGSS